jgi:hypothetical protein
VFPEKGRRRDERFRAGASGNPSGGKRLRGVPVADIPGSDETRSLTHKDLQFVLAGPGKTATSWLARCLGEHSRVFVSGETNFLTHHREKGWQHWETHFSRREGSEVIGEYANWYASFESVAAELAGFNPRLKIIFSVRDPVERAISFYRHDLRWAHIGGHVPLKATLTEDFFYYRYIHPGRYSLHLERFLNFFPPDQIYLFSAFPRGVGIAEKLDDLLGFLALAPEKVPSLGATVNPSPRPLFPALHRAARRSPSLVTRLACRLVDPLNVGIGTAVKPSPVSEEDRRALQRVFVDLEEKQRLEKLQKRHALRGRLSLESWG